MRTITEVLRLNYDVGLSHETIARACGLSKGVVSKYVSMAQVAGVTPRSTICPAPTAQHRRTAPCLTR
ncbi:hypothetical protein EKG36_16220 [Halomonas nitroreducens]|uniref:Uncharacterized protein n=1 Tax=Halomonas nitroreducens TaxID=447425 RepID=A0A3S0KP23_9GAMM|nr:hypothetical protein EKG36_16220 [Halomonas nitroreducens]